MTDTVFPYAWNAPRAAVGAYQADDSMRGFYYLTPDGKRKLITPMELAETDEKPDRSKAARRRLASLPHYVRSYYARQLEKMDSKGKKAADGWLLNTFERHVLSRIDHVNDRYLPNATLPAALMPLRNEFFRLLWAGKKELKRLAHNPAIRRAELMVRMRGFEDLAKLEGLAGDFYTLTAPSAYHSTQKSGRRNDKFNGSSPRDTQRYLCKVWSKTRAAWKRRGIRVFGFRVVEPHHDATPHWHLLLFMRPEHAELARAIFRKYALKEDGGEAGAEENRFKVMPIEEEHGSATGYIAKYISKNIDGYALDDEKDDETGEPLKDMARRVSAWASRWAIRQFQQIGGAPVTVYRELRRLRDRELVLHPEIAEAHTAADEGNWAGYVTAQGGPLVARDCLRVRLSYDVTENGNIYGDDVSRISGVYSPFKGDTSLILTRTSQYKIVPKRQQDGASGFDFDLSGGSAAPRSSVNNCTREPRTVEKNTLQESTVIADGASCAIDYGNLTRKEKKAVAARLSAEFKAEQQRKRERRKRQQVLRQPGERAEKIREFASSIGWDIGETEVGLLLAGQRIALDGVFYVARSDGALYRTREACSKSNMTTINTWLGRLGASYRYRPNRET